MVGDFFAHIISNSKVTLLSRNYLCANVHTRMCVCGGGGGAGAGITCMSFIGQPAVGYLVNIPSFGTFRHPKGTCGSRKLHLSPKAASQVALIFVIN